MKMLKCEQCGALNMVSQCNRCERAFVVTKLRVSQGMRQAVDAPLPEPSSLEVQPCDFCLSKDMKESVTTRVERGLRQRTCPTCETEFLSAHGLTK